MKQLYYLGWQGNQNIGDDAIFLATQKLLSGVRLQTDTPRNRSLPVLFGGGTILPIVMKPFSDYQMVYNRPLMCLGPGVNDPSFHNRRLDWLDLRWILGKRGYDFNSFLSSLGFSGRLIRRGISAVGDPLHLTKWYFTKADFQRINDLSFDLLGVRGPRSKRILKHYDIESRTVADPALYLEPDQFVTEPTGKIAITLRSQGVKWTRSNRYIDIVVKACSNLAETHDVVMLPFYPGDLKLHRNVAKRIPDARCKNYLTTMNIRGLLNEISSCDVMIGEKLHANVLAAACYVPFVSLEYRPKNRDFAESVHLQKMNLRIDRITKERFEKKLKRALEGNDIRNTLAREVPASRERLEDQADNIRALCAPA